MSILSEYSAGIQHWHSQATGLDRWSGFVALWFVGLVVGLLWIDIYVMVLIPLAIVTLGILPLLLLRRRRKHPDCLILTQDRMFLHSYWLQTVEAVSRNDPVFDASPSPSRLAIAAAYVFLTLCLVVPAVVLWAKRRKWWHIGTYMVLTDYYSGWRGEECRICVFSAPREAMLRLKVRLAPGLPLRRFWTEAQNGCAMSIVWIRMPL